MTTDSFSIRAAELTDTERIRRASIATRGLAGADPREAISDGNRLVIVADLDGEIVGWAKTHHYGDAAGSAPAGHYLGGVNVVPNFQRRGIGSTLLPSRLRRPTRVTR